MGRDVDDAGFPAAEGESAASVLSYTEGDVDMEPGAS